MIMLIWMYLWGYLLMGFALYLDAGRSATRRDWWIRQFVSSLWFIVVPTAFIIASSLTILEKIDTRRQA